MKKEWILNEDQLRRRKNSRLNSLKSCHSNQNPHLPQQQQFSPPFNNQNSHYVNKNSNVFSPESGILSPKATFSKGSFMSLNQQQQLRRNLPGCESSGNSPQSSNSSILLDLADYSSQMVGAGIMRPRNGSAGSSAFFGSRTSSHCSVDLPIINSPMSGGTSASQSKVKLIDIKIKKKKINIKIIDHNLSKF